jgi:FSR family fosmidomycin resistance protein-like MFS transporter
LGLVHATVDFATVAVLYAEVATDQPVTYDEIRLLVVLYNVLAFGLQVPLGILCDRFRADKPMALAGLGMTILAVGLSAVAPCAGIVLAGVGNALFHVGAGAIVLRHSEGRAADPGIFVAPGALGLILGIWLGGAGFPGRGYVTAILAAGGIVLALRRTASAASVPAPDRISTFPFPAAGNDQPKRNTTAAAFLFCVPLLFLSIAARSLLSDTLSEPWRDVPLRALALTFAAVAAKSLGGLVADRLGWRTTAVIPLLLLAPLAGAAMIHHAIAIVAVFLLQAAMPVTLAALLVRFPRYPGTSFGLASAALLLGAVPGFMQVSSRFTPAPLLVSLVLVSAGLLYLGLSMRVSRRFLEIGAGRRMSC